MMKLRYVFLETMTMFKRCMLLSLRNLDTLFLSIALPVFLMVLFVYVFGGSIHVGGVEYVNYIVPGVIILSIGQCASGIAVNVKSDIEKGIVDRFRSMPIAASSVLTGHVMASVVRNIASTVLVIMVAFLMGFRPEAGALNWFFAGVILLLYMLALTWTSVLFGLMAGSVESAGMFQMILMLLPYLSSGFVTTDTMPTVLRIFSENQPLTPVIESLRALLTRSQADHYLPLAILWCVGLIVVSYVASMRIFKRKAIR